MDTGGIPVPESRRIPWPGDCAGCVSAPSIRCRIKNGDARNGPAYRLVSLARQAA